MQAHHQEILQKITLQQSLTDTSTDRCAFDGPSYQVHFFCHYEIRAQTTEPMTGRHNCDGPSSGNRRVINEVYPTRPGWTLFQKSDSLNSPPLHISPHYSLISPITLSFQLPHSLPPIIAPSQFSQALKCSSTSENRCCGCLPCHRVLLHLFFSISTVCVSNIYSFILHFCY